MSELPSTSAQNLATRRTLGMAPWLMAILTLALVVAVIFAANSNQVVGWIVVVMMGLWLVLVAGVFFTLRAGARAVGRKWDTTNANLAAKLGASSPASSQGTGRGPGLISEAEMNHEMKLDHSFKIVQVQHGVVMDNLDAGTEDSHEQVRRALDTINVTASNARDMIKQRRKERHTTTVDGEILDDDQ